MKYYTLIIFLLFNFFFIEINVECKNSNIKKNKTLTSREIYLKQVSIIQDLFSKSHYDIALSKTEPLSIKYPTYPEAFVISGDSLFRLKSYEESYKAYLKSLYLSSNNIVYDKIREVLNKIDNAKLVTIKLKRILKNKPNDFVLRNILATFYIQLKLYDKAIEESNQVLSTHPWDETALANIALSHIYKGNFEKCKNYVALSEKMGKVTDKIHFIKGYLLIQNDNNFKEGEKEFIKAIKSNPFSQFYYYNLASLYMRLKKFKRASILLENAITIDSTNINVVFALAQSYQLDNKIEKAKETYRKLTHLAPTSVDGYLGLGKIHLYLNEYDETKKYFDIASKFDKTTLKFVNILQIYFQKYKYLLLSICLLGIISIIITIKKVSEASPKL